MPYSRILFGTDGSATALVAQGTAQYLAEGLGAALDIFTAETDPAEALIARALESRADLIVVGDVGMGSPRRLRLGGVPDRVSHRAPCDVLIVRTSQPGSSVIYRKVLIGTDGSVTAFDAARRGYELARRLGAEPTLVFVGPDDPGQPILDETSRQLSGPARIPTRILRGDPAEAIQEASSEFDVVAVGNKGMSGARQLLGSVPNKVSHSAPADVLIVQTTARRLEDLKPGEGNIVVIDGRPVAAYKAEDGSQFLLSPRCQHMGCTVAWNEHETTWDCPCHGSQYAADGTLMKGPATRGLKPIEE